jgi:glycosyltransferase involved in cell wall biosynthesis
MRVLHVHERAGFHGGVEQILYDTARGLGDLGWPQGLLHGDPEPQPGFLAAFEQASDDDALLRGFAPDALFLHKVEDADRVRRLAERLPTVRMVHDHDLVCMRRHKYFPISTRVCDRPAGIDCYLHLCFVQRAGAGSMSPIRLAGVGERKRAIRAHRAVRRFLVGSEWMRRELVINGIPPERIEIVPPIPAALAEIRSVPPSDAPELLFVGQVIRGKGVDLLLRSLVQVSEPWHATVVGTGNHLDTCRKLARDLGIEERVHFAGWVPHHELTRFYVDAALTVVPSRWPEPFGMVGIEAMARGRPVVGFAVGGIPDWLEDEVTGLLVPEADTDAMAIAIGRLLGDAALRRRLGEAGVRRVRERYQPSAYLKRLMQILETAA